MDVTFEMINFFQDSQMKVLKLPRCESHNFKLQEIFNNFKKNTIWIKFSKTLIKRFKAPQNFLFQNGN
jgi:hypothetical protein